MPTNDQQPTNGFDIQNLPGLLMRLLTASATIETLNKLKTVRDDVKIVRQHLSQAAVEIGAMDAPAARSAGIITLLGAIIDKWSRVAEGHKND